MHTAHIFLFFLLECKVSTQEMRNKKNKKNSDEHALEEEGEEEKITAAHCGSKNQTLRLNKFHSLCLISLKHVSCSQITKQ